MSNSHMEIFWIVNVNNKICVPHCSCKTVPEIVVDVVGPVGPVVDGPVGPVVPGPRGPVVDGPVGPVVDDD